jgi:ABC-2 type transport system ATP-binding protein
MDDLLVDCNGVGRFYGKREALKPLDLHVRQGQIAVLVGPNGSGKTTLLKILAGFLRPTGGMARVCGVDPFARRREVMKQASFCFAPPGLYETMTAWEHMKYLSAIGASSSKGTRNRLLWEALERVGLAERAHDRVGDYSFGMRQRLGLALAMVPRPRLLILDEPTEGLDPLAIRDLRILLRDLREETGMAILFSSHLLTRLEEVADSLVVLQEGSLLFSGPPAELLSDKESLRLRIGGDRRLAMEILSRSGHLPAQSGNHWITLAGNPLTLEEARESLRGNSIDLLEFHHQTPGLEDALMEMLRNGQASGKP